MWNAIYRRIGARREFPRCERHFPLQVSFFNASEEMRIWPDLFPHIKRMMWWDEFLICVFVSKPQHFYYLQWKWLPHCPQGPIRARYRRGHEQWDRTLLVSAPHFRLVIRGKPMLGFFTLQFETVWYQLCLKRKEGGLGCEVLNNATTFHSNCHKRRRTAPPLTIKKDAYCFALVSLLPTFRTCGGVKILFPGVNRALKWNYLLTRLIFLSILRLC